MKNTFYTLLISCLLLNYAYGELKNPHNEKPTQVVKEIMERYGIERGNLTIIESGFWKFESETSAVVAFETSERSKSTIEWGQNLGYGQMEENNDYHYIHIFHLNNLKKNQIYHLKFTAIKHDGSQQVESPDITIRTKDLSNAVRIPQDISGNPPYILDQANTYYLLTEDVDADSSAFIFTGVGSTLDLGGHTVIYNEVPLRIPTDQWTPHRKNSSFGIKMRSAGANMKVFNGRIIQGKGNDTASYVTIGFNPIYVSGAENLEIAGLDIKYSGVQITGIYCHWPRTGYSIHHNIVCDSGKYIINRHQQVSAIKMNSPGSGKLYNNLILRTRQTALALGKKSEAYNNEIHVDSYSVNSFGIGAKDTSKVYRNKIFGCGDNTCAIATTGGTTDTEVFDNYIWLQAHKLDDYLPWLNPKEMESTTTSTMSAIRVTWGGNRINYHNNTILVTSREGGIVRGSWLYSDNNTKDIRCENNLIVALSEDDTTNGWGAIGGVGNHSHNNAPPITFTNNIIVSNFTNYSLKDSYGYSMNYLFINNTFVKIGNRKDYYTINSHEGHDSKGAILIDSKFEGGAGYDKIYMSQYSNDAFTVKWTLHILAPNGTVLTIKNNSLESFNDTIRNNDKLDLVLTEFMQLKNNKQYKSPYTVLAKLNGKKELKIFQLDTIRTIKFFDNTDIHSEYMNSNSFITPNPAGDYIEIDAKSFVMLNEVKHPFLNVKVYDILGVCVLTHPLAPSREGESVRLDVSGLAPGIYFVRMGGKMYKFVKM